MFLPDYLETGIDSTTSGPKPLVASKDLHYRQQSTLATGSTIPPTTLAFGAVAALMAWAAVSKGRRMAGSMLALGDFLLFFLSGAVGLLLVFMWTGTDHQVCRNNLNLLWSIPTHLAAAFLIRKPGRWTSAYFLATSIVCTLLLSTWFFLPQRLNPALAIPVALLAWRGWALSRRKSLSEA
jgi:hypothetical protein